MARRSRDAKGHAKVKDCELKLLRKAVGALTTLLMLAEWESITEKDAWLEHLRPKKFKAPKKRKK